MTTDQDASQDQVRAGGRGPVRDASPVVPGRRLVDGRTAAMKAGCSYRHWLRMCDKGLAPPGTKFGHLRRWDLTKLDDWISAGCPRVRSISRNRGQGGLT